MVISSSNILCRNRSLGCLQMGISLASLSDPTANDKQCVPSHKVFPASFVFNVCPKQKTHHSQVGFFSFSIFDSLTCLIHRTRRDRMMMVVTREVTEHGCQYQ